MRQIKQKTGRYTNGMMSYNYSYYMTPLGEMVHGYFESYCKDGSVNFKGFGRHNWSIGLTIHQPIKI